MAPPPSTSAPADRPLQQRLLDLVQTLQFAWYAGHVTLLLCTIRYALSYFTFNYYTRWARFSYRAAFLAAAVTYGIVVFKSLRAKSRAGKLQVSPLAILGDENVQYLTMAFLWLFSHQIPLAILPFTIYSVFHVATYTRSNILPTIHGAPRATAAGEKPKPNALADTIGRFVKDHYDASMTLVAILEIALWFRLAGSAILFQKRSWILLFSYTVFLRARFHQNTFVQNAVTHVRARGDAIANRQDMPPVVRQGWESIKQLVRQGAELTDINRYAGGPRAETAPKKAQ